MQRNSCLRGDPGSPDSLINQVFSVSIQVTLWPRQLSPGPPVYGRVAVGPAFMHCILINCSLPRQERNLCTHCPCPLGRQTSSCRRPLGPTERDQLVSPQDGLPGAAWDRGRGNHWDLAGRRSLSPREDARLHRLHSVLWKQRVTDYRLRAPRSKLPICHCSLDRPSFGACFWFVSFRREEWIRSGGLMATKNYSVPMLLQGKLITALSQWGALKQQS